ncbi:hypothetical protein G4Z16_20270 [Streptomyces bathyalis]|uniref:SpdC2 protein n=1 Tax=Streptomyces bathyalis TaxID=2710756 RepID=A0A7T1T8H4_9ACTN|nr:hypothetical protein [Streptomyces bathyalis]QPP08345.1 hypothetical protein G4Z16_20270 [Streptomyces bathyalis]
MTIHLPLVLLLVIVGYFGIKLFRPPTWLVIVLLLGGFLLADTFLAPAIEDGTRTGTQIVNDTND